MMARTVALWCAIGGPFLEITPLSHWKREENIDVPRSITIFPPHASTKAQHKAQQASADGQRDGGGEGATGEGVGGHGRWPSV